MQQVKVTEGATALTQLCERGTYLAVGARVGVDPSTVRHWAHGRRTPKDSARVRMAQELGIDVVAWDRPVTAPEAATMPGDASVGPGPGAPSLPGEGPSVPAPFAGTRERLREVAARIEADLARCDENTPVNHRASLYNALTATYAKLSRLEGDTPITESMILRSPHWRRLCAKIMKVIERHPGLADEMLVELDRFENGGESQ